MTAPLLRLRDYDPIGGDNRQAEPACRGKHGVALSAGPELGVEILGPAELEHLLQEACVAREKDEAVSVSGEKGGQSLPREELGADGRAERTI